ncbi:MAG TPA: inositol monophosphatase family protein [Pilimelia sp.]|nr:inositol monophosphatase family protein [Pilimelia sp.]
MLGSDADVAVAAAGAGAVVVRARYGTAPTRVEKPPSDFATTADLDAEAAILQVLRSARPGDAYLGEESGSSGDDANRRRWLIDPLCGTANFAARTPLMCVNVALGVDGVVRVAAAADPMAGDVYWTDGIAAWVRHQGDGNRDEPIVPSAVTRLVDVNLDPWYPCGQGFRTERILTDPAFRQVFQPRVTSTTLALTWVASGRRAAYVSTGDLRDSVHFSAGIALSQAAGCIVTGLRGQPVHTGEGGLVAAADAHTHDRLVNVVNSLTDR